MSKSLCACKNKSKGIRCTFSAKPRTLYCGIHAKCANPWTTVQPKPAKIQSVKPEQVKPAKIKPEEEIKRVRSLHSDAGKYVAGMRGGGMRGGGMRGGGMRGGGMRGGGKEDEEDEEDEEEKQDQLKAQLNALFFDGNIKLFLQKFENIDRQHVVPYETKMDLIRSAFDDHVGNADHYAGGEDWIKFMAKLLPLEDQLKALSFDGNLDNLELFLQEFERIDRKQVVPYETKLEIIKIALGEFLTLEELDTAKYVARGDWIKFMEEMHLSAHEKKYGKSLVDIPAKSFLHPGYEGPYRRGW